MYDVSYELCMFIILLKNILVIYFEIVVNDIECQLLEQVINIL